LIRRQITLGIGMKRRLAAKVATCLIGEMKTALVYPLAAIAEIAGCFAFWAWLKLDRSPLWPVPGVLSLIAFAWLLTLVPSDAAGRAFASYGGVYICASLVWMGVVEKTTPDRWDILGGAVCLLGAAIVLFGPRG